MHQKKEKIILWNDLNKKIKNTKKICERSNNRLSK